MIKGIFNLNGARYSMTLLTRTVKLPPIGTEIYDPITETFYILRAVNPNGHCYVQNKISGYGFTLPTIYGMWIIEKIK